jgi:hypothetical protein
MKRHECASKLSLIMDRTTIASKLEDTHSKNNARKARKRKN